jgi:hypothetical protein
MDHDVERLKALSMFSYATAGIGGLVALLPVRYLILGIQLVCVRSMRHGDMDGAVGIFFIVTAGILTLGGLAVIICAVLLGRNLARWRHYSANFSLALVVICFIPIGTILGIATMITLKRPSTKSLFSAGQRPISDRSYE